MKKNILFSFLAIGFCSLVIQAQTTEIIRLNQVGFYPNGTKKAVIISSTAKKFSIINATNLKDTVFAGNLSQGGTWQASEETTQIANFTDFKKQGKFVLYVYGLGNSHPFSIGNKVHQEAAKASIKSYYYQRTGIAILPKFAGQFARPLAHPDTEVLIHSSAVSEGRAEGTKISSPKGWYDAGDYNKYIVNSGISTYSLMALQDDFAAESAKLALHIPESNNKIPDLVDEINWNLRWMLSMQDPTDGGVYHKLTNANFDKFIMPDLAITPRYVVAKSTAATLDFCAVMAHASSFYKKFEKELPGLADSCKVASIKAYEWAKKNPTNYYQQETLKNPAITTGGYGDRNVKDEFFWAATELFLLTENETYLTDVDFQNTYSDNIKIPDWGSVGMLGIYSVANCNKKFPKHAALFNQVKADFVKKATELQQEASTSAYQIPMGLKTSDFVWGSNAVAANQAMFLIKASLLGKNKKLIESAQDNLDYLLGRNALGFSFLTGFGSKSVQNIHHRPSYSDGIVAPIPGFLAGGPNPGQQDIVECITDYYQTKIPAKSFIDNYCAYACNEVAINWNAPFVYTIGALEALNK